MGLFLQLRHGALHPPLDINKGSVAPPPLIGDLSVRPQVLMARGASSLPSRRPIQAFRLCRPDQESPVQNTVCDLRGSGGGCPRLFLRRSLTGSPLGPAPPGPPFGPILPCWETHQSSARMFYAAEANRPEKNASSAYDFSLRAFESLRTFFSGVALETSDQTHSLTEGTGRPFRLQTSTITACPPHARQTKRDSLSFR